MLPRLRRASAATSCIALATFLPLLPGRYESLEVPLSGTACLLGWAGLLHVPVGTMWLARGRRLAAPGLLLV